MPKIFYAPRTDIRDFTVFSYAYFVFRRVCTHKFNRLWISLHFVINSPTEVHLSCISILKRSLKYFGNIFTLTALTVISEIWNMKYEILYEIISSLNTQMSITQWPIDHSKILLQVKIGELLIYYRRLLRIIQMSNKIVRVAKNNDLLTRTKSEEASW